jgi:hypothetical protein
VAPVALRRSLPSPHRLGAKVRRRAAPRARAEDLHQTVAMETVAVQRRISYIREPKPHLEGSVARTNRLPTQARRRAKLSVPARAALLQSLISRLFPSLKAGAVARRLFLLENLLKITVLTLAALLPSLRSSRLPSLKARAVARRLFLLQSLLSRPVPTLAALPRSRISKRFPLLNARAVAQRQLLLRNLL